MGGSPTESIESFFDLTHVWVVARIGGISVPFDWGNPRLNSRFYRGYAITSEQLEWFVEQDKRLKPGLTG